MSANSQKQPESADREKAVFCLPFGHPGEVIVSTAGKVRGV